MRTIIVTMSTSLDGVVQGLGRADEDTRDGFDLGGWGPAYHDDVMNREMGAGMAEPGDLLLGRRTWEDFAGYWPHQPANPVTDHLDAVTKHVVSTSLTDVDRWQNSLLLSGDGVASVSALKASPGPDLSIIGSAALVRSLHAAQLIDVYTLLIHPLVLGRGRRMFDETSPLTGLTLERTVTTTTGVVIATYRRNA